MDVESLELVSAALDDGSATLLMAEYEHAGASLLSNEEMGEKRVDVFLTLIAAVTAAIGLAADRLARDPVLLAIVGLIASLILLVFGLVTLRRIMHRNIATTELLNGLRRIRASFVWRHPNVLHALPFVPGVEPRLRTRDPWWGIGTGGFLETVAAANCFLVVAAAAAASWLLGFEKTKSMLGVALMVSGLLAVFMWPIQMWWTQRTYRILTRESDDKRRLALEWWRNRLGPSQ